MGFFGLPGGCKVASWEHTALSPSKQVFHTFTLAVQCEGSWRGCALLSYPGRNPQKLCWIHSKSGVSPSGLPGAESGLYFDCQLLVGNSKTTWKENHSVLVALHQLMPRFLHFSFVQLNFRLNLIVCGSKCGQLKTSWCGSSLRTDFCLNERLRRICSIKPMRVAAIAHFVGSFSEVNESCGGGILPFK